jgi:Trk-type K+ transport system membrane component
MLRWWIDKTEKYFNSVSIVVFTTAVGLLIGQVIEAGVLSAAETTQFEVVFKIYNFLFGLLCVGWVSTLISYHKNKNIRVGRIIFLSITMVYTIVSALSMFIHNAYFSPIFSFRTFLGAFIGFVAISYHISILGSTRLHPALLFVISFLTLIAFGTFCLLLPEATHNDITFTQAFFTSTSAVTVTGLAVLDTGKDFTTFGQTIILILIQLGGLGILTVTNILALLFNSSTTYRNRMMVSDMIKELNSNNTFSTLFNIIAITLTVEAIGAFLIYFSIFKTEVTAQPIFFSVFHAISAFCNAGFSPMSNSVFESTVRFNYSFQLIICWLIITGGLGYMVMISHFRMLKNSLLHKWANMRLTSFRYERVLIKSGANTIIVLRTTLILLLFGWLLFFLSEYDGVLKDHDFYGKLVVSFFNSVTARTAGFNNVDMSLLSIPATMLIIALMWIGASPASTGGGIKTTTFALGVLNLYNQIVGKERIIFNNKEISNNTLNQVSAVIFLSVIAIGSGTFALAFFEPKASFKDLIFEVISAYSTVGLSLNVTPTLSEPSLYVLAFIMFLGRVSFLTLLIGMFGFLGKKKTIGVTPYYPKDQVFIN